MQVFLNVTYAGGYTVSAHAYLLRPLLPLTARPSALPQTIYNGVFNQDSYIFAGDYEDNTGYRFSEVYKVTGPSHKLCTNYEVHGELCELGCNAGVSCQNHSCTCGTSVRATLIAWSFNIERCAHVHCRRRVWDVRVLVWCHGKRLVRPCKRWLPVHAASRANGRRLWQGSNHQLLLRR